MSSDGATDIASEEPALTLKNSATVTGEETLASDDAAGGADTAAGSDTDEDTGTDTSTETDTEAVLDGSTSTHTKLGAIPSSYGAAGGTTDAYEEGAGESESGGSGT